MTSREFAHLQPDNAEIERSVLAQEVETLRNRLGLRQVDVSKECGVNASMLSQWMLGRYKGNVARINGLMESWLIRRRGGKPMDKIFMNSSPKMKRAQADGPNARRKRTMLFAQRELYKYPKEPAKDCYLIPIRLDVDVEGYRYIDSFSWNLYETDYTYETFAAAIVRDLDLPECFYRKIADSIAAQVEKTKRTIPWHQSVATESLHPIFINIRIKDTILIDRFEWDLSNEHNDPEHFAQVLCDEMGLSGEFEAQIALSIREQLRDYSRLIREGLRDRVSSMPPVTSAFRDRKEAEIWGPQIKYILADDIPQLEREDFKRMRPHSQSTSVNSIAMAKPNRPPKPVNTFLMFCRERRKQIMEANPNTCAKDASKILGEIWQKLSEDERARFQPMTDLENERRLNEWRIKEKLPMRNIAQATMLQEREIATISAASSANNSDAIANDMDEDKDMEEDEEDDEDDDEDEDMDEAQSLTTLTRN